MIGIRHDFESNDQNSNVARTYTCGPNKSEGGPNNQVMNYGRPRYGITGCGIFKAGIQNWKGFCIKINFSQMKLLNFENWTNEIAKIRDFKIDYLDFLRKKVEYRISANSFRP